MALKMDNLGTFDIANLWSVGGRMHHVDVCAYFLHELKDRWLLVIRHIAGDDNEADIFTKNVTSAVFNRHIQLYMGLDEYINEHDQALLAIKLHSNSERRK